MFLYVKSTDCIDIFPYNNPGHFRIKLAQPMQLSDYTGCAIIELSVPLLAEPKHTELLFLTNFVNESLIGSGKLPIVHRCIVNNAQNTVFVSDINNTYFPVKEGVLEVVEIKVLDNSYTSIAQIKSGVTYCAFHFLEV